MNIVEKLGQSTALAFFLIAPLALGGDINGFWKHAEEPGWIEISLADGNGTVVRNEKFPERVGRDGLNDPGGDGRGGTFSRNTALL